MPFTSTPFATQAITPARVAPVQSAPTMRVAAAPATMKMGAVFSKQAPSMAARVGQTKMYAVP